MKNANLHIFIIPSTVPKKKRIALDKYLDYTFNDEDKSGFCVADSEDGEIVLSNLDSYRVKMLILFIKNLGIPVEDYDATQMIIKGSFDENVKKIIQDSTSNEQIIRDFVSQNLDVDFILDKISECGIDSLTNEERIFLDSQSTI